MTKDEKQSSNVNEDPVFLEALSEMAQVAAGRTANKLYEMTNQRVDIQVPEAHVLPADVNIIAKKLKHVDEETIGVFQPFQAFEMEGKFAFLLPLRSCQELLALLGLEWKLNNVGFNEEQNTTLKQVGTILAEGFISGLGLQLDLKFVCGIGNLQEGTLEHIIKKELQGPYGQEDLVIVTIVFTSSSSSSMTGEKIVGYYSLFLDQRGMGIIENSINKKLNR